MVQSVLAPFENGSETPGSRRGKPPCPFHTTGSIKPKRWFWSKDHEPPDILGAETMSRHWDASWFTHLGPRLVKSVSGAPYMPLTIESIIIINYKCMQHNINIDIIYIDNKLCVCVLRNFLNGTKA